MRQCASSAARVLPSGGPARDRARARVGAMAGDINFLRGGPGRHFPAPLDLVATTTSAARVGGSIEALPRMFHSTVLPDPSCAIRPRSRWPMHLGDYAVMDWAARHFTMSLPARQQGRRRLYQLIARQAMAGQMPESIRMGRAGRLQLADAGRAERAACRRRRRCSTAISPLSRSIVRRKRGCTLRCGA